MRDVGNTSPMANPYGQIFYLPCAYRVVVAGLFFFYSLQLLLVSVPVGLAVMVATIPTAVLAFRRYTVEIRSDGVKLYGLWWLPWDDVRDATFRRILGQSYIQVRRRHGWPWWIPLYFVGDGDLRSTIVSAAPDGHVIRRAAHADAGSA